MDGLTANVFGVGLFVAAIRLTMVAGLVLLWNGLRRGDVEWSSRQLAGALLAGAGLTNLVEGLIDHHVLGIRHVRPGPDQLAWDLAYLAFGVL